MKRKTFNRLQQKYSMWKERICDGIMSKGEPKGLIELRLVLENNSIKGKYCKNKKENR